MFFFDFSSAMSETLLAIRRSPFAFFSRQRDFGEANSE